MAADVEKLRRERKALVDQARALVDQSDVEKREMSVEENRDRKSVV